VHNFAATVDLKTIPDRLLQKPPPKATGKDISTPREAVKKPNLLSFLPIGMRKEN